MRRIRRALSSIAAAPGRAVRAVAGVVRRVIDPLRPTDGTTEGAVYWGLVLIAAGLAWRGRVDEALLIPGAIIVALASAPVIVGILRRGS